MNMNVNISLANIGPAIGRFLHRFGLVMIFVIISIGLIIAVILLNAVIVQTDQANGYTSESNNVTFDEATLKKIEELKVDGEKTERVEMNGRLLPF